jgi:hypothetical protein
MNAIKLAACCFLFCFVFWHRVSHYVAQAGLKLTILLAQPPKFGITGVNHHSQSGDF